MDALQQVQALRVDDVVRVYYDLDRQKVQELRVSFVSEQYLLLASVVKVYRFSPAYLASKLAD
jgi:hypothetical protein